MNSSLRMVAFVVAFIPLSATTERESVQTPVQQYSAIFKQYSPVSGGLRGAETDIERKAAV